MTIINTKKRLMLRLELVILLCCPVLSPQIVGMVVVDCPVVV